MKKFIYGFIHGHGALLIALVLWFGGLYLIRTYALYSFSYLFNKKLAEFDLYTARYEIEVQDCNISKIEDISAFVEENHHSASSFNEK